MRADVAVHNKVGKEMLRSDKIVVRKVMEGMDWLREWKRVGSR